MDVATEGKVPGTDFPEDRLVKVFTGALRKVSDDAGREEIIIGALKVGYQRGLMDGIPPLQPDDMEAIAARFNALAGRIRWLQEAGADLTALTFDEEKQSED